MNDTKFSRIWAMPNKYTFQIGPLKEVVYEYMRRAPGIWVDPFAGYHSPVERGWQNDLNPAAPTDHHLEACDFLLVVQEHLHGEKVAGVVFDPPYSVTQVSRSYKDIGLVFNGAENPTGGFPKVRDLISAIVRPGGYCVSYGWNTVGMGKKREFDPVEYLICSHGGNRNDTLVTVERRQ